MYSIKITQHKEGPFAIPSDFTKSTSEVGRSFIDGDENNINEEKVEFFINGVRVSIDKNGKNELDNSSSTKGEKDIFIDVYLNNDKKNPIKINIGKHISPEKNWSRFITELLEQECFNLKSSEQKKNAFKNL